MKKIALIALIAVSIAVVSVVLLYFNQAGDRGERKEITYIDVSPEEAKNLINTNPDLIVRCFSAL